MGRQVSRELQVGFFAGKAWRGFFSEGDLRQDSSLSDAWTVFVMDDGWMDGVMDFVGFLLLLKAVCFQARGRVGGTRRTWPKIALARGRMWEALAFSSANDNPLRVLGVS